jgi:hypothetical protein
MNKCTGLQDSEVTAIPELPREIALPSLPQVIVRPARAVVVNTFDYDRVPEEHPGLCAAGRWIKPHPDNEDGEGHTRQGGRI